MIRLDGSQGEGGGQIVRTALSVAPLIGEAIEIENVRARRSTPGLKAQHVLAARAVAQACGGRLHGDEIGSTRIRLDPGPPRSGAYRYDVGSVRAGAGSTTLVLETVLPTLIAARGESRVEVVGGTHNPWAPPADFVRDVFLRALEPMGVRARLKICRHGFYPRGGGEIALEVASAGSLTSVDRTERGALLRLAIRSAVAALPRSIAERQARAAMESIGASADATAAPGSSTEESARGALGSPSVPTRVDVEIVDSIGPGTFLTILAEYDAGAAGFTALGERGKRAEEVGREAAEAWLAFDRTGAAVDAHLADQLVLYAALADGESAFSVSEVTRHLTTNLDTLRRCLGVESHGVLEEGKPGSVFLRGRSAVS